MASYSVSVGQVSTLSSKYPSVDPSGIPVVGE